MSLHVTTVLGKKPKVWVGTCKAHQSTQFRRQKEESHVKCDEKTLTYRQGHNTEAQIAGVAMLNVAVALTLTSTSLFNGRCTVQFRKVGISKNNILFIFLPYSYGISTRDHIFFNFSKFKGEKVSVCYTDSL